MAWIRLSDDYVDHPKFSNLCDGAFRLWHQGMAFCRKFQTDGLMPTATIRQFKAYSPKRMKELMQPWRPGMTALWEDVPGFGVKVHDYLEWNLSKEVAEKEKGAAKDRMALGRERRKEERPPLGVRPNVRPNIVRTSPERSPHVPGMDTDPGLDLVQNEDEIGNRAAAFLERYPVLYREHRKGAQTLIKPSLDWVRCCDLCRVWDSNRLEKLAVVFLTTDDEWISRSDRGFGVFVSKASWCDDRLRAWEVEHGVAV